MAELLILSCLGVGLLAFARAGYVAREARARRTFKLTYPRGGSPEQVLAFVRSLSGLLPARWGRLIGSPSVAIETRADATGIHHYLRLPAGSTEYVLAQLRAALPGVRVEEAEVPPFRPRLARALRVSSRTYPLRAEDPTQSATALLATLAPLRAGERAVIQWVVTPAPQRPAPEVVTLGNRPLGWAALLGRSEPVRVPAELVRGEREKRSEPPLYATARIGIEAADAERERHLLRRVLGAFHLGTSPQARFRVRRLPCELVAAQVAQASAEPFGWPCLLNAAELAAFAGIPIGEPRLPGLTLGASPQLPPAAEIPSEGRVLGIATFPGAERPVAIAPDDNSFRHLHCIGPTGSGKTSLALNLICADLAAGHGVIVVDPKGDMTSVLGRIPPHRARDVILLDPSDEQQPVGFNLLAGTADELAADQVVALFKGLYPAFWGPRTDDLMRAATLTLTRQPGMTLAELPLILTDEGFRRRLTSNLDDYVLTGFWAWYEALTPGERAQAVGPVLNKLRTFLLRKRLRNVIGQSRSTFSLAEVLAEQKVLLVNLSKGGALGDDASRLLGSAVLAQLWQAVQARAALPESKRPPVFCYVDEFQDFVGGSTPASFADFLAQARSYRFGVALLHQGFFQLPSDLKQAVLTNARSRVAFQLAHTDAVTLAKEFGPDVSPDDLGALGAFEAVAQVSAGSQVSRPVSIKTPPPPPATGSAEVIRARSRERYGRPVAEVEAELRARAEGQPEKVAIKRTRRAS